MKKPFPSLQNCKAIISLCLLLVQGLYGNAQTIVGDIYTDTTFSASGNPYIVTATFVVFQGATLTIEPGVIIKFNPDTTADVRGKLIAIGTATDYIEFTSNASNPAMGDWDGLFVSSISNQEADLNQVIMKYVKGSYSNKFINLDNALSGPYVFENCIFSYNWMVNRDGGRYGTFFNNCDFISNYQGLDYFQFYGSVTNCNFINNHLGSSASADIESCYFSGNDIALSNGLTTKNCIIENNIVGVSRGFNTGIFENNTIQNNQIGIEMQAFFDDFNFNNNIICHNTEYNVKLFHNINADLSNNCWCSEDSDYIRSTIYDGYVNSASGLVTFLPLGNCDQNGEENGNFEKSAFVFYPNPFKDVLLLEQPRDGAARLNVYNEMGLLVHTQNIDQKVSSVDMQTFSQGIFFYAITDTNDSVIQNGKIVKY